MNPAGLEAFIHERLPLTKAMGVHVLELDEESLRLGAPLELNLNHKRTAFGGSLESLATITCWMTIYVDLCRRGLHPEIVIRRCEMRFLHTIACDFSAVTRFPGAGESAAYLSAFHRRKIARITLESRVEARGQTCAQFQGEFVALGR